MSLIEEIKPWVDEETGMIQAGDGGRDNLVVMTATLVSLLPDPERLPWLGLIDDFAIRAAVEPGLVSVDYHRVQGMSPDNICALMVMGDRTTKSAIMAYGRKTFWTFNCERPGRFGIRGGVWFIPGFVALMKIANDEQINPFSRFVVFCAAIVNALSAYDNTTNKCLQRLWNRKLSPDSLTVRVWRFLMSRKYPGGEQELLGIYHKIPQNRQAELGQVHPYAKYAPSNFK